MRARTQSHSTQSHNPQSHNPRRRRTLAEHVLRGPRPRAVAGAIGTTVSAVLLAVAAPALPASAHTALRSATPASGATVRAPEQIVLTYNDPVRFTQVVVFDARRRHYESGRPVVAGDKVTQRLIANLPDGGYTVAWRVVSPDGHPLEGDYRFTVTGGPAASPQAPSQNPATSQGQAGGQAPAAQDPARQAGSVGAEDTDGKGGGSSSGSWWWIAGLVIVLIGGAGLGAGRLRRREHTGAPADTGAETGADTDARTG